MHRFWHTHILPMIECAAPKRILEIGAEFGWNTAGLLDYASRAGAHVDVVDPMPHPVLHEVLARNPAVHSYHPLKSLAAIPLLPAPDFVLLDGDHNWFTVHNEFVQLHLRALATGNAFPIIVMHDCAWPYGRRDMYYDVENMPPADRQPYARRGMRPGRSDLTDDGLNGHFDNALHEGGPRNGVLTGAEDFIATGAVPGDFRVLPFFNGLGIFIPTARRTDALQALVESFWSGPSLLAVVERLERDLMEARADLYAQGIKLKQRTQALTRARALLAER